MDQASEMRILPSSWAWSAEDAEQAASRNAQDNKALNRIDGFEKLIFNGDFDIVKASDGYTFGEGFLKFRDKNSTIYADDATFHDIRCHDLKTEFKDAAIRASYLCKSSQKKELPERYKGSNNQTFGGTRKLRATNSEKVA